MRLDDPALPAVRHLVGEGARDVLRPPVEATGGAIADLRVVHVQYRPGSDVVVRYSAMVSWQGAPAKRETLVAASAVHGTYPGVVTVVADTTDGPIEVGVWKWPFDPFVVGLGDIVTAAGAADVVGLERGGVTIDVVAYRPTERAVVRVNDADGAVAYVKAVRPERAPGIAARHEALRHVDVPAPPLRRVDGERGLVAMDALAGPTFRELVKRTDLDVVWPDPGQVTELCAHIRTATLDGRGPASRLSDGVLHARMLATVLPPAADELTSLSESLANLPAPAVDGVVHGDLHEGQLIVDDGRIVGVLDVDDAGPGASVDDVANLLARLHYREVTGSSGHPERLQSFRRDLRQAASADHDVARLDAHTAAALIGLATGPFRIQADGWRRDVTQLIERARRVLS